MSEQDITPNIAAYKAGYLTAIQEIRDGRANIAAAKERGLYPSDQDLRIEWDYGYEACVCAYRLGHDVQMMANAGLLDPSLLSTPAIVSHLLDGTWPHTTRPDPRCRLVIPGTVIACGEGGNHCSGECEEKRR